MEHWPAAVAASVVGLATALAVFVATFHLAGPPPPTMLQGSHGAPSSAPTVAVALP